MNILFLLYILININFTLGQFPTYLNRDEISDPHYFDINGNSEFLLTISASSSTNWSISGSESATLMIALDNEWINYNQDIVLYGGDSLFDYNVSLGYIPEGNHSIEIKFDYIKPCYNFCQRI